MKRAGLSILALFASILAAFVVYFFAWLAGVQLSFLIRSREGWPLESTFDAIVAMTCTSILPDVVSLLAGASLWIFTAPFTRKAKWGSVMVFFATGIVLSVLQNFDDLELLWAKLASWFVAGCGLWVLVYRRGKPGEDPNTEQSSKPG